MKFQARVLPHIIAFLWLEVRVSGEAALQDHTTQMNAQPATILSVNMVRPHWIFNHYFIKNNSKNNVQKLKYKSKYITNLFFNYTRSPN